MMADPLLVQSAVDRLVSAACELIIEAQSYGRRQKLSINHQHDNGVSVDDEKGTTVITRDAWWSLSRGNTLVSSPRQATGLPLLFQPI